MDPMFGQKWLKSQCMCGWCIKRYRMHAFSPTSLVILSHFFSELNPDFRTYLQYFNIFSFIFVLIHRSLRTIPLNLFIFLLVFDVLGRLLSSTSSVPHLAFYDNKKLEEVIWFSPQTSQSRV